MTTQVYNYFPNNYTMFDRMDYVDNDFEEDNYHYIKHINLTAYSDTLSLDSVSFDSIQFSPSIVNVLSSGFKVNIDKFVPNYSYNQYLDKNLMLKWSEDRILFLIEKKTHIIGTRIEQIFLNELKEFFNGYNFPNELNELNNFLISNFDDDKQFKVLYDDKLNIVIITKYYTLTFIDNICVISNNMKAHEFVIFSNNKNYFSLGPGHIVDITFKINNKMIKLNGSMIDPSKKQNIDITYDYKSKNLKINNHFYNANSNLKLISNRIEISNGDIVEFYNKNGLMVNYIYNKKTNISKLVSNCTVNDSNLRYRGKYEEKRVGDKIVSKKLTKSTESGDKLLYNKEYDQVLIDNVNNEKIKDEILIGWKVAKSPSGENRIIKLMIPNDAQIILPIDEEFFNTKGKERCDKAIVMDIQLPDESDEISVVPHEMVAYSYIYKIDKQFEYKVGKEIIPDSFDTNDDVSCTHGIHFYRNRHLVFDVYINRK